MDTLDVTARRRHDTAPRPRIGLRAPARCRPGGRPTRYPPHGSTLSRAPHAPVVHHRWRAACAWVLSVALVVPALVTLRSVGSPEVPRSTAVVQVRPGESLSELAVRVAPGAPPAAVVERIVSLNGMPGAAVRVGESLVVPHE